MNSICSAYREGTLATYCSAHLLAADNRCLHVQHNASIDSRSFRLSSRNVMAQMGCCFLQKKRSTPRSLACPPPTPGLTRELALLEPLRRRIPAIQYPIPLFLPVIKTEIVKYQGTLSIYPDRKGSNRKVSIAYVYRATQPHPLNLNETPRS